jgi:hypothetical protein
MSNLIGWRQTLTSSPNHQLESGRAISVSFTPTIASLSLSAILSQSPLEFEKDDDSNGHIDYITACSVRLLQLLATFLCKKTFSNWFLLVESSCDDVQY